MSKVKRTIPDYHSDLISLVDAAAAMNRLMSWETRLRVLNYIVKRELGDKYYIAKSDS